MALGVVAQYVFLFVVFGALATRIGLGRLFIDLASLVAGRFAGGPAKVAIFSSAMLGTISGSSIANTVTTGALTIPAMKRVGYRRHFAGAVEAASSTGGQITPPIMGAAAFIMVEYLEVYPYREILLAALFPAMMHYIGIFVMVHLEAKRLGLRGLSSEELPRFKAVLYRHWMALAPLFLLLYLILTNRTPDFAAFWAIVACVVVGFISPVNRLGWRDLIATLGAGVRSSLAVGAAAGAVGIIVGVVTGTGTALKLQTVILTYASDLAALTSAFAPLAALHATGLTGDFLSSGGQTLFFALIFTAVTCIILGAGIPTTATYIILVAVAAPVLQGLGITPLAAHFFVFYYGVLADITPPVALAAYAGAGIAGANPFRTGNTAFRLGIAKALVPFVFVYSPAFLLVTGDFTWGTFLVTLAGAVIGIALLGAAFVRYLAGPLAVWQAVLLGVGSLFFVAPGAVSGTAGALIVAPVLLPRLLAVLASRRHAKQRQAA